MTSTFKAPDQKTQRDWWPVLLTLCLAEIIFVLESMMMFAAMPRVMAENGGSAATGWLITAYFLVSAASAALCSVLGDKFGRKRVLMLVFCGAAVGSVISAVHDDLTWIVVGRAVQGLAGAILPLCYGLIKENLPSEKVAFGIGAVTGSGAIGSAAGFIIAGIVIDHGHWQQIFTISAVLSLAMAAGCGIALPRSPMRLAGRLDILGGVVFLPGILAVMYAVSAAKTIGWLALAYAVPGVAILIVWLVIELRHSNPLIDLRLFKIREILLVNVGMISLCIGSFYFEQIFPMLMQQSPSTGIGFGLSATMTGFIKLPGALLVAVAALLAGPAAQRWGGRSLMIAGALGVIGCWSGLMVATTLWLVVLLSLLLPVCITIFITGAINIIVAAAPSDRTSEAVGMNGVLNGIGKGIGGLVVASLLAISTISVEGQSGVVPSPESFRYFFLYMIATAVVMLLAALALPAGKLPNHREAAGAPRPASWTPAKGTAE